MRKTLLLLFISGQVFCQKINFKGIVLDKASKEPVVYANISFMNKSTGVSTIEDGTFRLMIVKDFLNEKVHISCLNYKDTIVFVKDVLNKKIYLIPNRLKLDEVFLKKNSKEITVDKLKKKRLKTGFSGSRKFPWIVTKFFPNKENYKSTPFIKKIKIQYATSSKNKAKYRLRFYKNNEGKPGNDINSKSIIVTKSKNDKSSVVPLYDFNIHIPKEGLFVGLERINIPYNFYNIDYFDSKTKQKTIKNGVSPVFGSIRNKNSGTWFFQNGVWQIYKLGKHKDNSSLVPAISLTLSN